MRPRTFFLGTVLFIFLSCLPLTGYIYDLDIQIVDEATLYAHWSSSQPEITGGLIRGEYFPETAETVPEYTNRIVASTELASTFHRMVISQDIEPGRHYSFVAYNIHPVTYQKIYSLELPIKIAESNGRLYQVPLPLRGPRIAFANPEGVAFDIETNIICDLKFRVEDRNNNKIGGKEFSGKDRFSFRLDGMEPGQEYLYRFTLTHPENPEVIYNSDAYSFSPAKPQGEPFRFAFMSDARASQTLSDLDAYNGVAYATLQPLAIQAKQHDIDLMIFGGDLIDGYTSDRRDARIQYQTWIQAMAPIWGTIPVYPTAGNHDATAPQNARRVSDSMEELWRDIFVLPTNGPLNPRGIPPYLENVYAIEQGDVMFLMLNPYYNISNIGRSGAYNKIIDEQLIWLEAYLRRAVQLDYTYIIVVSHTPAFPAGRHYGRCLDQYPEERDEFWDLLQQFSVDLYLCGHEHFYSRLHVNESVYEKAHTMIPQITSGRAGAPPYQLNADCPYVDEVIFYSPENNYVIFDISSDAINMETYNQYGEMIDKAQYSPRKRDKDVLLELETERVRITRVIDGDTVEAEDGRRIRNIGIDAPEVEKYWLSPPEPGEPFGDESTEFVEEKILNKEVFLKYDADKHDRFGRTLAYVFYEEDGELYHLEDELIKAGLASLYTVSPHFAYTDNMLESQNKAMDEGVGIWSLDYDETADYYVSSYYFYRFHLPDCDSVEMIERPYRVYHDTIEDALRKGLSPCRGCQPHEIMAAPDDEE